METRTFTFTTPLIKPKTSYDYAKQIATAHISGTCEISTRTDDGEFDYCYATLTNVAVILEVQGVQQDSTLAYNVDKAFKGDLADLIDNAICNHCSMLFTQPVEVGSWSGIVPKVDICSPESTNIHS